MPGLLADGQCLKHKLSYSSRGLVEVADGLRRLLDATAAGSMVPTPRQSAASKGPARFWTPSQQVGLLISWQAFPQHDGTLSAVAEEEARQLALMRLDYMLSQWWEDASRHDDDSRKAFRRACQATREVLRILDQEHRIQGLYR